MSARGPRRPRPGDHEDTEPERYELHARLSHRFAFDRREFLTGCGGGLLFLLVMEDEGAAQQSGRRGGRREEEALRAPAAIGAWLHIGEDGGVTAYTGKVEIGQQVRTSLGQAVAEEVGAPLASISLVMGDTGLTPFDRGTTGSRTTPDMGLKLRQVAAAARGVLIEMAARRWSADPASLTVADGRVLDHKTARALTFGELTRGRRLVEPIDERLPLAPAERWRIAGTSARPAGAADIVTGRLRYTSDLRRPSMAYGSVLRPPRLNARLIAVETRAAEALPGVTVVRDGDFVGAVAPTAERAAAAVAAVRAEWRWDPQPSRRELFGHLKANPRSFEGRRGNFRHVTGSLQEGRAAADRSLERTYQIDYIAHVPLEPRAAIAEWSQGGRALTVWTGTQRPFGVQAELAEAFRLAPEAVRVIVPDTGSAYGGKHTGEAAVEAARLAKAAGRPVRLVWTREEEFTWAYFRPAGVIDVRSGIRTDGRLTAWEFRNYNSGYAAIRSPYDVPHQDIEFQPTDAPLRQGSYRALAATANHFARETHLDELADALGLDPLELRLRNLSNARLRAVLTAAADRFGWSGRRRGVGLAGGVEKGSYVATCAEVAADQAAGRVTVRRLVVAFECGAIVNPDDLMNQVEGAVIMGLGGALFEAIDFEDGAILNPTLSTYRVPRFRDVPVIDVVLLDRKDLPSAGAGETPIVGVAPAVGNAICAATGVRLRSLPLLREGPFSVTARP